MPNLKPSPAEARAELARRELARRRYLDYKRRVMPNYQHSWHFEEIAKALERLDKGETKRLIITLPPRHGKSMDASVYFPAWYLGRHPTQEVIVASYALELAQTFGRQAKNVVASEEWRTVFSERLAEDSQSAARWSLGSGGSYVAVGVGGPITGRGADLLVLDDTLKNREEAESRTVKDSLWAWWQSTAYTRLSPEGKVLIVATRWAQDDLIGRLLSSGEKWEVIHFPAIATRDEGQRRKGEALWPQKWPLERLEEIKRTLSAYEFSALYQGEPLSSEHQEFKESMFKRVPEPSKGEYSNCYLSVDTAVSKADTADYTGYSLLFVTNDNRWIIKSWRARHSPLELLDTIFGLYQTYRPERIGIEKTVYLQAIKPFLDAEMRRRNIFLPIIELQHGGTAKETRIRGLLPRYESGSIWHVDGWHKELEDELLGFPRGLHDDVVDSAAYLSQLNDFLMADDLSIAQQKAFREQYNREL